MVAKRIFLIISILIASVVSQALAAETKIDPYLQSAPANVPTEHNFRAQIRDSRDTPEYSRRTVTVEDADVFIKTSNVDSTTELIRENGGSVHTVSGDIITATLNISSVRTIAGSDDVEFIEVAKPIHFKNDMAALDINSAEAHDGYNLPEGYTGKNVIVGIIDTGIDYTHPDFKDANGNNRIIAIWNQTRSGGPAPQEIENSYGTECGAESIADGSCPLKDTDGHGTHVAGTAAGRHGVFGGIAPDANIIVVSYDSSMSLESGYAETIFSTKICQAAYYIFKKAEELQMPAVVNLSLGTHIGAHDGTSLFEQCLDGLLIDKAGRAIVAAAGNEYSTETNYTGIHAGYEVSGQQASNFVIRQISKDKIYYVDFWGSSGSKLSVGLAMRTGTSDTGGEFSGLVEPGRSVKGSFLSGKIEYSINYSENPSALNGKPHAGILLKLTSNNINTSSFNFDLVVSGQGSFDAWLFPDKPSKIIQFTSVSDTSKNGWKRVPGDNVKGIAIPATSPNIIAVTAYTTRNKWDAGSGCCEISYEGGNIVPFSSSGPTAAPDVTGVKPDIAAPGAMIASARSSQSNYDDDLLMSDGSHALQAGTSMAAPFVSGTIALMFSANADYTHEDARRYIIESAYVDEFVGNSPNDRWGHGKLDVLAAIETAVNGGASGRFERNESTGEPPVLEDESSSQATGGGCSIALAISGSNGNSVHVLMIMLIIPFAAMAVARTLRRS